MTLPRRAHNIVRCEVPPRCCHLGDSDAGCPSDATYVCDEHRGAFAGVAWPVSG